MARKSILVTFLLALVPGVGHYYLGLNNRGLQFMVAAAACLALTSLIPGLFLMAFAVLWFYCLFDALQRAAAINAAADLDDAGQAVTIPADEPRLQALDTAVLPIGVLPSDILPARVVVAPLWLGVACIVVGLLALVRQFMPYVWAYLFNGEAGGILLSLALIAFGAWVVLTQARRPAAPLEKNL